MVGLLYIRRIVPRVVGLRRRNLGGLGLIGPARLQSPYRPWCARCQPHASSSFAEICRSAAVLAAAGTSAAGEHAAARLMLVAQNFVFPYTSKSRSILLVAQLTLRLSFFFFGFFITETSVSIKHNLWAYPQRPNEIQSLVHPP